MTLTRRKDALPGGRSAFALRLRGPADSLPAVTDDQLAALVSIGVPAVLLVVFVVGHRVGAKSATRVFAARLRQDRVSRVERWTPPPPQPAGDPGTPERLLSDYEDAIYTEARHSLVAQYGEGDEQQHMLIAAQLHADVRRLRGQVFSQIGPTAATGTTPSSPNPEGVH